MTGYCSTKFAVRGFSEALRAEMVDHRHPVHDTVVQPGGVKTNIATAALDEAATETHRASPRLQRQAPATSRAEGSGDHRRRDRRPQTAHHRRQRRTTRRRHGARPAALVPQAQRLVVAPSLPRLTSRADGFTGPHSKRPRQARCHTVNKCTSGCLQQAGRVCHRRRDSSRPLAMTATDRRRRQGVALAPGSVAAAVPDDTKSGQQVLTGQLLSTLWLQTSKTRTSRHETG